MPVAGYLQATAEDISPGRLAGTMKGASMQIDEKDMTIIGFILTWIAGVFGGGVAYGRLSSKVAKIDQAIFDESSGDIRIITYPAHDIMVRQCHEKLDLRISNIMATNNDLKADIKELGDTVKSEMKGMADALQKIAIHQAAHTHHRKSDES